MTVKNICACPDPPGGSVQCEPDQAAYCRVVHGTLDSGCLDPPQFVGVPRSVERRRLNNWALELITGQPREPDDPVSSTDEQMLASGEYDDGAGTSARFRLPWDVFTGEPIEWVEAAEAAEATVGVAEEAVTKTK